MAFSVFESSVLLIFEEASLVDLLIGVCQVRRALVLNVDSLLTIFAPAVFVEKLESILVKRGPIR